MSERASEREAVRTYADLQGVLENAQKAALVECRKQRDTAIRERDEARSENERLRALLVKARAGLDHWSTADLDGLIDEIDAALGHPDV